ncbi:hypothetical protein HDE_14382 [Halotydeus destructor]|nr:hypothetical protein HDE_14382 [Halotydeus destructor]
MSETIYRVILFTLSAILILKYCQGALPPRQLSLAMATNTPREPEMADEDDLSGCFMEPIIGKRSPGGVLFDMTMDDDGHPIKRLVTRGWAPGGSFTGAQELRFRSSWLRIRCKKNYN